MSSDATIPAAFTGSRVSSFRYELLDLNDQLIGPLDGVETGSLQWSAATSVKVGGSLEVTEVMEVDWLNTRVRIWRRVGDVEWSRGVYVASAPRQRNVDGMKMFTIELLGKLALLNRDEQAQWVTVPAGVNIIDTVRSLLAAAGHHKVAITDAAATLSVPKTWEPTTSLLLIVNELLDAAGYWSLTADDEGFFVAQPYVLPADRPARYDLLDDANSIYEDDFTVDRDIYSIPNRVVIVGNATEDDPPLVGVAENLDSDSEYSIPSRGQVISYQEVGFEAANQTVIDDYARRRLVEKSQVSGTVPIRHAPLPLDLNDAVRFRREPAGIDALCTVQAMTEPLSPLELTTTVLRMVVDL